MKRGKWVGIVVGTLIASGTFWLGLFTVETDPVTGLTIIAVGIIFAMYTQAVLAGVENIGTVAFHSALYAIVAGSTLVVLFSATRSPSYLVAAPTFAIAVGGAVGMPPVDQKSRTLLRFGAAGAVSFLVVAVYWVDLTVYAMIAPLVALPVIGLADRVFDRAVEVMDEDTEQTE